MLKGRPNTARGKERNAVLEKGKMVTIGELKEAQGTSRGSRGKECQFQKK